VAFKFQPIRTIRYYRLKFLRLKGDPESIARGVGLGVFIGITPTLPLHTIAIVVLAPLLRGNIIAAILAATLVSNPFTFFPQYYLSWHVGNWLIPCDVSWESIQSLLNLFSDASFRESIIAFSNLGRQTIITLLTGGVLLAIIPTIAAYFLARTIIIKFRKRRFEKHILS
jgi:uncharacterized protein (TIGR03546 family)